MDVATDLKKDAFGAHKTSHKIRITLTSTRENLKKLEALCSVLVAKAKDKGLRFKGPVRFPTRRLTITTRKTPCGEGSKTWDKFEMRIHKRVISLFATAEDVQQVTTFDVDPGVQVDVLVDDE